MTASTISEPLRKGVSLSEVMQLVMSSGYRRIRDNNSQAEIVLTLSSRRIAHTATMPPSTGKSIPLIFRMADHSARVARSNSLSEGM